MNPGSLAFGAVAVAAGAYVRGYSGFGSSLIWVSSLSLVLPPVLVVPAVYLLELGVGAGLLPAVWREAHWRSLRWLVLGVALGTGPGVYLLAHVAAGPARVAIAVIVLTATALMWRGFALAAVPGARPAVLAGTVAGVLNGWTGIGGPPAILFYFSSPAAVAVSRASLIAFLLVLDLISVAFAGAQGLVTRDVLVLAAVLALPVALGIRLGRRRFVRADPESFRRMVFVLLALLSCAVLARALLDWRGAA